MADTRELCQGLLELQRYYFDCLRGLLSEGDHAHPRQGPILALLLRMDGSSQAELVRQLGVSAATVAVSVARLERLGYVCRERNMHNQRANILRLTDEGRAEATRLENAMKNVSTTALEGFSDEEQQRLMGYFMRMKDNLGGLMNRQK
ncbi:MAG: MarR family winged helix-turn-helix transcriptional regulator [Eubacteriales bacterium]|nr:MarR family winged helix-turn-helix transcriptional regulator [Eubacteriales bacterium]